MVNENTLIYGLIGKKIGHSYSAKYFNKLFEEKDMNAKYLLFPLENINLFPELLDKNINIHGLNVTVPYKEEVIQFLDEIDNEAREIGAINVIKVTNEEGERKLKGYNTDVFGFKASLQPLLNPGNTRALVLGTGGASKAVAYALKSLGITVTMVSRSETKGDITYNDLTKEIIQDNLLIVNTTPLGMFPEIDTCPPIPYEYITPQHLCYDVVYNPEETLFLKKSKKKGAQVKNGLEMLRLQAEGASLIWGV